MIDWYTLHNVLFYFIIYFLIINNNNSNPREGLVPKPSWIHAYWSGPKPFDFRRRFVQTYDDERISNNLLI